MNCGAFAHLMVDRRALEYSTHSEIEKVDASAVEAMHLP